MGPDRWALQPRLATRHTSPDWSASLSQRAPPCRLVPAGAVAQTAQEAAGRSLALGGARPVTVTGTAVTV